MIVGGESVRCSPSVSALTNCREPRWVVCRDRSPKPWVLRHHSRAERCSTRRWVSIPFPTSPGTPHSPLINLPGSAGLVLGGDVLEFLRTFDRDKTNLALETKARVYWSREDTIIGREERSQLETSWCVGSAPRGDPSGHLANGWRKWRKWRKFYHRNALYHALRSNFDGAPGDASSESTGREGAAYKLGCTVTDICVDDDKDEVTVRKKNESMRASLTVFPTTGQLHARRRPGERHE